MIYPAMQKNRIYKNITSTDEFTKAAEHKINQLYHIYLFIKSMY